MSRFKRCEATGLVRLPAAGHLTVLGYDCRLFERDLRSIDPRMSASPVVVRQWLLFDPITESEALPDRVVEAISAGGREGQSRVQLSLAFSSSSEIGGPGMNPWPKDCLRHSYGSYHLAKFRHAGNTAENMGHRNTDMLYKHYRDVIKDQGDVDAFWKLGPPTG